MRIGRRHAAALAIATIGTAISVAPMQTALADSPGPVLSTSVPHSIDLNGAAGDIDLTVANPPVKDAYFRLMVYSTELKHLHFTDDSGAALPAAVVSPGGRSAQFDLGTADTDHNGVRGTPLTEGNHLRLHLSADFGASAGVDVDADLMDGATGNYVDNDESAHTWAFVPISQPTLSGSWTSPGYEPASGFDLPLRQGSPDPALLRITTRMPMRTPPASTHIRWIFTAQQIAAARYTASEVAKAVTVQYSSDGSRYTRIPWTINAAGALVIDFPSHVWGDGADTETTDFLRVSAVWGLPGNAIRGVVQVVDGSGQRFAEADQYLDFYRDWVPTYARHSFYGRDAGGVLWQYQETDHPVTHVYAPRTRVGGGWQTYDVLAKLSTFGVEGNGDLVARDRSGVLWYYRGSGNSTAPFATRVRVGGGWQMYDTLLGAGDVTGDGAADLLARDHNGVLWLYKGTGNPSSPFASRTRVGGGWNTYTMIVGGADVTGDGRPDLVARDHDGVLWLYRGTGSPSAPFAPRTRVGGGWNTYTSLSSPGSLGGNNEGSLLARDHNGSLWIYYGTGNAGYPFGPRVRLSGGWNTYNAII